MNVNIFWGYSKKDGAENLPGAVVDQLKQAVTNGVQFEISGNQSSFGEYLDVIDIVGSHQKSSIFLHNYEEKDFYSHKKPTSLKVKEFSIYSTSLKVFNEFMTYILIPTSSLIIRIGQLKFNAEEIAVLIEKVNSFTLNTLIFQMDTNMASFYPYFD